MVLQYRENHHLDMSILLGDSTNKVVGSMKANHTGNITKTTPAYHRAFNQQKLEISPRKCRAFTTLSKKVASPVSCGDETTH